MQARIKPVITVDDPSVSFSEEVQGYGKSSRLRPIFIMTSTMETGGDVGLVVSFSTRSHFRLILT